MRLFIILLLFFFKHNIVYSDPIYNLIKIPNLEVYDIKNDNGIKYLNANKNFSIGVENNIKCNKSNKKNLNSKFSLISKNLQIYELGKKININQNGKTPKFTQK